MSPRALLAGVLLAACAGTASAWTWGAPPDHVVIGTPVTLSAQAPGLAGAPALAAGQKTGPFEVLKTARAPDGTVTVSVMAFALGRQALPALRWAAGSAEVESPPLELTVAPPPPTPTDTGDIRDIRGPYAARMGPWWALLALLAAGLATAAWRLTRRRPAAEAVPAAPADTRSPEDRALDALDALDGQGLSVKEFYDRMSDIVRLYLRERHGLEALGMTSHDLQRALIRGGFAPEARQLVKALSARCDLAKFARLRPSDQEGRRDLEAAKKAVKLLAPAASEVEGDLAGLPPGGHA